jgi:hypothetical protein
MNVVKLTDDWVSVTRGEEYAVLETYTSKAFGACYHLALIERLPGGRVALTERRTVPQKFVKETGEVL